MKHRLNLAAWLLLAAIALQTPAITYAKEDTEQKKGGLRKRYLAAKELYEKRKKEHAPKKELDKLEAAMKEARRKWRWAIFGIATAAVATAAAAGAAATVYSTRQKLTTDLPSVEKPELTAAEKLFEELNNHPFTKAFREVNVEDLTTQMDTELDKIIASKNEDLRNRAGAINTSLLGQYASHLNMFFDQIKKWQQSTDQDEKKEIIANLNLENFYNLPKLKLQAISLLNKYDHLIQDAIHAGLDVKEIQFLP